MSNVGSDGFEWQQLPQQEEEEEDELEEGADQDGVPDVGESKLARGMDQWDVLSPHEIPEDNGLLEELKDNQGFLAEGDWRFDLGELHDFACAGETDRRSPTDPHEHLEDSRSPENHGLIPTWRLHRGPELAIPEDDQGLDSSQDLDKRGQAWCANSEGESYPELSYEGQYGSEYSASPEALRNSLALYKSSKSYSFTSEGEDEEFSENSNLSPSPSGPPPECTHLKIDAFETQSLQGESQEFPEETALTYPSRRNPRGLSSPAGSTHRSHSPLSEEDLQNPPGIEAEIFPESSWVEKLGQPVGAVVKTAAASGRSRSAKRFPLTAAKPKERPLDLNGAMQVPHTLRQVGYQQRERLWKLKADVPHGLPSKLSRQSRSLSPQGRAARGKAGGSGSSKPIQASQVSPIMSDTSRYGRGQLNYPLPDLSKVEPRVRFPKDPHSYHPPRGKTLPARAKESRKPVIFKSPAEIVREVLLSSGEGSLQKCPTISVIPEEFKSPEQATELVHQLQEDYHKLLTKYAEAENTIDRLRLGAKVRLYSDPPKPSHGVQMGTVSQASKVMTFTIPQVRTVEVTGRSSPALDVARNEGFPGVQAGSFFLPNSAITDIPGADGCTSAETPISGDHLTRLLAAQASKFQTQMENLEELIRTGRLPLQDQLKGFARLKGAQGTLEQAYLQARDEFQQLQNNQQPLGVEEDFDPDRAVEGEIFHLQMHLEELKERIGRALWDQPIAQSSTEAPLSTPTHFSAQPSEAQMRSPAPSLRAPVPAARTAYPQVPVPKSSHSRGQADVEVGSISDETGEEGEGLPEPLRHMQVQVEKDFDQLLDHYSSFKSLPEALSLEQLDLGGHNLPPDVTDAAASGDVGTKEGSPLTVSKDGKAARVSSASQEPQRKEPPELFSGKPLELSQRISRSPSAPEELEAVPQESAEKNKPSAAVRKASLSRRPQEHLSPQSSMAGVTGSAVPEHVARKSLWKNETILPEDPRLVSPETDSGFVGSEASRVSPLAQTPKHRSTQLRSRGMLGKPVGVAFQPTSPKKVPVAMEMLRMNTSSRHTPPEDGVQRCSLSKGTPFQLHSPPRWTNSITSEMDPGTDGTLTDSEAEVPGGLDPYDTPPDQARQSPVSSADSLSPVRTHRHSLLDSRLERDQAIAALQKEVSWLRQSLEETLHQPHGDPNRASSPCTSTLRVPCQGSASFSTSASPKGSQTSRKSAAACEDPALIEADSWAKKPSLPQDGTRLDLSPSESDYSPPKPWKGKRHETSASRMKSPKQPILRGPYTGIRYPVFSPESQEPKTLKGSAPCPQCQDAKSQLEEESTSEPEARDSKGCDSPGDSSRPSQQKTQKKPEGLCRLCKDAGKPKSKVVHGIDHGKENPLAQSSGAQQTVSRHHQPQQPGLWYWVVPSPASSISYVPTIPLAPYPPSSVTYCSPLMPQSTSSPAGPSYHTSKHQAAEPKTWTSWRQPREGPCCSLALDCSSLQDLNWSLSRAVGAARDMKLTTKRISRSLASDLNKARCLRGSCLF
ncbi:microtubule organization protein AKNA isoform X2 [Rhineura floridana]|uniref:microtubule organization protein AKNA isoform X2 n=1 Tax=Rhineura floridana TaxID=261503 RepID=UPI002AC83778|nr:microtubule organization protein AKNA isoform X2 [Rhineura floridana]